MNEAPALAEPRTLDDVMRLTAADRRAVDRLITKRLRSDIALVNQISQYIIGGGGKRLRPLVHLLSARAAGYHGQDHLQMAAIIEFIHTATLLHDDVVDESGRRRGRATAHRIWGNAASVLVGDFLYSRSFQMMVELHRPEIMALLANTTNRIAEGEVLQLMQMGNAELNRADYFQVISDKTACLFAASARLGGIIADGGDEVSARLAEYGLLLGQAFQITDDVLDYASNDPALGKSVGDDLAEGKVTLPLILALQAIDEDQRVIFRDIIRGCDRDELTRVRQLMEHTGALDAAMAQARELADRAIGHLDALPAGTERTALMVLANYAVERSM